MHQTTFMPDEKKRRPRRRTTDGGSRTWGSQQATVPSRRPDFHRLGGDARQVYTAIEGACAPADRANKTGWRTGSISREEIHQETGRSVKAVGRAIRELVDGDWIRVSKSGGRVGVKQRYVILKHADPAMDVDPDGPMPFPVWTPAEGEARRLRIIANQAKRDRVRELEAEHEAALESGDAQKAREAFVQARRLRAELSKGRGQGDFFGSGADHLTSPPGPPEVVHQSTSGGQPVHLKSATRPPEVAHESTLAGPAVHPILFPSGASNPSLSPAGEGGASPVPEEREEAAGLPAPFAVADLIGPAGGEALAEGSADLEEAPDRQPEGQKEEEEAAAASYGEADCPDCDGTGIAGYEACGCAVRRAERARKALAGGTASGSGLLTAGAARNAEGAAASVDELRVDEPEPFKARRLALKARPAWPGPGEALTILGDKEASLAALAMAETVRRQGSRVLALVDVQARQEDSEAALERAPGPVSRRAADGLGALVLVLEGQRSHPVWSEKLRLFIQRARNQGAALVVATSMGPRDVARIHGEAMVEALGGTDAQGEWKGIVR